VKAACRAAEGKGYHQIKEDTPSLEGAIDPVWDSFMLQVAYQHTLAYGRLLGLTEALDVGSIFPFFEKKRRLAPRPLSPTS
jgi:hypothetical protein